MSDFDGMFLGFDDPVAVHLRRKNRGKRHRWGKKYRLGKHCSSGHPSHSGEHYLFKKTAKRSERKARKNVCSSNFLNKNGADEVDACFPVNKGSSHYYGLTTPRTMKPRFFNQNEHRGIGKKRYWKYLRAEKNRLWAEARKRKISLEREAFWYGVEKYNETVRGDYDKETIVAFMKSMQNGAGWYTYSRSIACDRYDLIRLYELSYMYPHLDLQMVPLRGHPCANIVKLSLVNSRGNCIKSVDFMTILTIPLIYIDTRVWYYYVTDSNLVCRMSGYDLKKVVDSNTRDDEPPSEEGKPFQFAGSTSTERSVPDEDDDSTGYKAAKILRQTVCQYF
jgi:hypothetical protein